LHRNQKRHQDLIYFFLREIKKPFLKFCSVSAAINNSYHSWQTFTFDG